MSFSVATQMDWGRAVQAGERSHTDETGVARAGCGNARAGVQVLEQGTTRNAGASAG